MKYLACLFDLDGTLIDSLPQIHGAVNKVRAHFGWGEVSELFVRPHVGLGLANLIEKAVFYQVLKPPEMGELRLIYKKCYMEQSVKGAIFPGVRATLVGLQNKGIRLSVVTNRTTELAVSTIDTLLPEIKFEQVQGADKVTAHKPDPAHLTETLEVMGVQPDDAIYVGDHEVDFLCASAAKVRFFGVSHGYGEQVWAHSQVLPRFSDLLSRWETL